MLKYVLKEIQFSTICDFLVSTFNLCIIMFLYHVIIDSVNCITIFMQLIDPYTSYMLKMTIICYAFYLIIGKNHGKMTIDSICTFG